MATVDDGVRMRLCAICALSYPVRPWNLGTSVLVGRCPRCDTRICNTCTNRVIDPRAGRCRNGHML